MGKCKFLKQKKQVQINGEWVDTRSYRYILYCDGSIPCVIIRDGIPNGTVKVRTRKIDGSTVTYPGDITSGDKTISLDSKGYGYLQLESDDCIVYVREIWSRPYSQRATAEIRGCIVNSFGGGKYTTSGGTQGYPKAYIDDVKTLTLSCSMYNRRVPYYAKDHYFSGSNIIFRGFDTSNVTNMNKMFFGFKFIKSLDLKEFDTRNVTDMAGMFAECTGLTSVDLSSFDTSNVTNFGNTYNSELGAYDTYGMFYECYSLKSLDLSHFNTSNATIMCNMFYDCRSLTSLDLSNFNTSNVTRMNDMFYNCYSLTSLNLNGWDTRNVTNMKRMFTYCEKLTSLDLRHFNTSNVFSISSMFAYCSGLTSLNLSGWDTHNISGQGMSNIFYYCSNLESLDLSGWDMSKITHASLEDDYMFKECPKLKTIRAVDCSEESIFRLRGQLDSAGILDQVTIITE